MLSIYKNESYLLEDEIKQVFNNRYKNIDLRIVQNIFNELLQGMDFQIFDKLSNSSRTIYVSIYDYTTASDFYRNSLNKIDNVVRSIIRKNYFK